MNTFTHNPLASPPAPRGMRYAPASEPVCMSWYQMATRGMSWPSHSLPVLIDGATPYLNQAIERGRELKNKLDRMSTPLRESYLDTPTAAIRLRIYLAAAGGMLDHVQTETAAMIELGVLKTGGTRREEWK